MSTSDQNRLNVTRRSEDPAAARGPLEIRLLGPLEVSRGAEPVPIRGSPARALLALLCLHRGAIVSVDRIVDELWGEQPPKTARHMVEVYISQLRKLLGPEAVATRAPGYALKVDLSSLDVARFEQLLGEGREALAAGDPGLAARLLAEALSHRRGPPLSDFAYEPFAQDEIARLEEALLSAREELLEAELSLGRSTELVDRLERLVAEAPFRERPRAQLMLALYRAGRQADALAAYREARTLLVDELGVEPGPRLRELERAILAQDERLLGPAPPRERGSDVRATRRVATILFAELAAEAKARDPEVLRPAREQALERAEERLRAHGATVECVPDGTVMAVFGIPVAHEDDAVRSLRAVDELRESAVVARAGVATGEVLTGRDPVVRGAAVRQAAELLARAAAGEVLADELTRSLAASAATFEQAGQGVQRSLRVLTVARAASSRPLLLDTPLVGRRQELAALDEALRRAVGDGRPSLVTVVGEAGVGKSRLARAFAEAPGLDARALAGRCLAYGNGITYWPLREVLEELAPDPTPEALERPLGGAADAEAVARRLAAVAGRLDDIHPVEEVRWAARRLFEELARERPLLIVFDDVHWAEPGLLDLVDHVVDVGEDAPIMVLCLARPELEDADTGWPRPGERRTVIGLQPLTRDEAEELVARRDPGDAVLPDRRAAILGAAQGNPLFLEQLVAFAAESPPETGLTVPPSLQALLAARLDLLGPGELTIVECAAVVGREFWVGAVAELVPDEARSTVARHLESLQRKALIEPEPPTLPFERGFRFRHVLIQESAYRSVPKERRAELHERLAHWLERAPAAVGGDRDEVVGYHLEHAYMSRAELGVPEADREELGRVAAERLVRAGKRATTRGDTRAAVSLLGRAHRLVLDPAARLPIAVQLALAHDLAGQLEHARDLLSETIEAAQDLEDARIEWRARIAHAFVSERLSPKEWTAERSTAVAERAIEALTELGDDLGLSRAWDLAGARARELCRWDEAAALWRRSVEHARRAEDESAEIHGLGDVLFGMYMGRAHVADVRRETEAFLERVEGLPGHEADGFLFLAGLHGFEGTKEEARELYVRAKAIREELGLEIGTLSLWAEEVALLFGDGEWAERELRAGYESLGEIREASVRPTVAAHLAEALLLQGRDAEAALLADVALETATVDDVASQARGRAIKARVLASAGEHQPAEQLAREAVDLLSDTDDLVGQGRLLVTLAEVLRLGGQTPGAADALRAAIDVSEEKGNVMTARQARALLAGLDEERGAS